MFSLTSTVPSKSRLWLAHSNSGQELYRQSTSARVRPVQGGRGSGRGVAQLPLLADILKIASVAQQIVFQLFYNLLYRFAINLLANPIDVLSHRAAFESLHDFHTSCGTINYHCNVNLRPAPDDVCCTQWDTKEERTSRYANVSSSWKVSYTSITALSILAHP